MSTYDLIYEDEAGERVAESGDGSPCPPPGTGVVIDGAAWIVVSHQWYVNVYPHDTVTSIVITVRRVGS